MTGITTSRLPASASAGSGRIDVERAVADLIVDRRRALIRTTGLDRPSAAVAESWTRSLRYGLDPGATAPQTARHLPGSAALRTVVDEVLAQRQGELTDVNACVGLTDADGVVLDLWGRKNRVADRLEGLDVVSGFQVDETTIGTTSGASLVARHPTFIRGPEHFAEQFTSFTSAGMVIVHPVSRRVVGSLNLICDARDTSPLALAWIRELIAETERRLLSATTGPEQALWQAFVAENRDARHPVVAVNAHTVLANAAAARLLGAVDQALLWELASSRLASDTTEYSTLSLANGAALAVRTSVVVDAGAASGVVMRLRRLETLGARSGPGGVVRLPGLAGSGPAWTDMRRKLCAAGPGPVLLVGEPGVGKLAIARTLSASAKSILIGRDTDWRAELATLTAEEPLVIGHLDRTPRHDRGELGAALREESARRQVLATSQSWPASGALADGLRELFLTVVPIPSLAQRPEDIGALLDALTRRHCASTPTPQWMPDAVQALTRAHLPENVRTLEHVVVHVLEGLRHRYIGVADLPTSIRTAHPHRPLTGLERVEADAILQALQDARGNKQEAAASLGIARSTLYRKMRALHLDLSATTF